MEVEHNNILEGFFYCFKHMQLFENKPEELKQPIWTRLFNSAQFAAMNKHEQLEYIKEMNTERDIRNQISYARECGKAEGKAEGLAEGKDGKDSQTFVHKVILVVPGAILGTVVVMLGCRVVPRLLVQPEQEWK